MRQISQTRSSNKQCTSAGRYDTSPAGARALLILLLVICSYGFPLLFADDTSASAYSLSVSYSGAQSIDIIPGNPNNPAGTGTKIAEDEITVTTTCRSGYNFAVGTSVSNNNLYLGGDSSANTAGTYFTPSDGTTALNNAPNTWGYYYNASNTPTASSVFSSVPAFGTAADVLITPTASSTDISDTFSVYYGVAVANSMPTGTYKMIPDTNNNNADGTIVYYATMAEACTTYTVQFNPTSTAGGTIITGTGTMDSQAIHEGIATNLAANTFTAPTGYAFAGWNTSQDGTGTAYADEASVIDLTTAGNTIILYAQWEKARIGACPSEGVPGYICYDGNGADAGEMPNQQASADTTVTLQAYNYKRDGYGFLGWSTVKNPTIGTDTIYGPMEDITTPSTMATAGLNLYAVWLPKSTEYTMQTFTSSVCSNNLTAITYNSSDATFTVSPNSFIALEDTRDSNVYAVARLADGNCWMLENLRLNESATRINTAAKSQNGNSFTISRLPASTNSFTTSSYTSIQYNKNNTDIDNSSLTASYNTNSAAVKWYGYGNYYSWAAARGTTDELNSGNTATSLCPANWHMPYGSDGTDTGGGNTRGGFYYLADSMSATSSGATSSNRLRQFPNNFVSSGYWSDAQAHGRGSMWVYWSSTAYDGDSEYAYYMVYVGSFFYYPGTAPYGKYNGSPLRCVAGS